MGKKIYVSPLMTLTPDDDPTISFGGSQGTIGTDSVFTWDSSIDPADIDLFWANYDDTDLQEIDGGENGDKFISYAEFYAWWEDNNPL